MFLWGPTVPKASSDPNARHLLHAVGEHSVELHFCKGKTRRPLPIWPRKGLWKSGEFPSLLVPKPAGLSLYLVVASPALARRFTGSVTGFHLDHFSLCNVQLAKKRNQSCHHPCPAWHTVVHQRHLVAIGRNCCFVLQTPHQSRVTRCHNHKAVVFTLFRLGHTF